MIEFIFTLLAVYSTTVVIRAWRRMGIPQCLTSIFWILLLLAMANELAFMDLSVSRLGGFASLGRTDSGHFFVGNHGQYREVTSDQFTFNLIYEHISGLAVVVSGACFVVLLLWRSFFRQSGARWSLLSIMASDREITK